MADIKVDSYEEDFNYPKFTEDMVKTHTILIPSMLPIHMALFESLLCQTGYKVEIMKNEGPDVVTEGLKYVHNDTCYPALLVIGQFIDNLNHRNDHDKLVLLITQTGGGCRASNYLHLLRKALKKAGYGFIPVVSLNASNLEKDSGFKITLPLVLNLSSAITYADELMYLRNKCQTYEINKGETAKLVDKWIKELSDQYAQGKGRKYGQMKKNLKQMVKEFDAIPLDLSHKKPRVGIVGEIYIKYASLGNNHLEDFLVSQGAEVNVPGLYGFLLYTVYNTIYDYEIYGKNRKSAFVAKLILWFIRRREKIMINAMKGSKFTPMNYFSHTKVLSVGVLHHGTKMGEGWLLTAEMMELTEEGYENIICAQPFGCLPNHICGKGVMKKIKSIHKDANIVAIDYDPSATKVNQENRIKLMLAIARERIKDDEKAEL